MNVRISQSEAESRKIAAKLAKKLKIPAFICLYGDLGSGKTVFTKGLASGLGIPEKEIKSPTYTFVREYKLGKKHFYHFDFYRIEAPDDLMSSDLEEIFSKKNAIIVVEWPEHIQSLIPPHHIAIRFEYIDPTSRKIILE